MHVYDCIWGISQSNAVKPSHRSLLASKKIYAILIRRVLLPFPVYHKETIIDVGQCILQQLGYLLGISLWKSDRMKMEDEVEGKFVHHAIVSSAGHGCQRSSN